jgi:hypothetical protein
MKDEGLLCHYSQVSQVLSWNKDGGRLLYFWPYSDGVSVSREDDASLRLGSFHHSPPLL